MIFFRKICCIQLKIAKETKHKEFEFQVEILDVPP
jgi:hypothetical protein